MQRILIVDDAEINRELLHNMLSGDYAVDTASDGEEALNILSQTKNETAAILRTTAIGACILSWTYRSFYPMKRNM